MGNQVYKKIYVVYETYETNKSGDKKYIRVAFYKKENAKKYCADQNKLGIPFTWYDYEELNIKDFNEIELNNVVLDKSQGE